MAGRIYELRPKGADNEKITINLGHVDLGQIDLLVQEGFYSNRSDFIRTAIRNQLERHNDAVKQTVARKNVELGLRHFSREDLEAVRATGEMLHIRLLGLASIANDVTPELACATIGSIEVLGASRRGEEERGPTRGCGGGKIVTFNSRSTLSHYLRL